MTRLFPCLLLFSLLLLFGAVSLSADNDWVALSNEDRLSGEVQKLERQSLSLKTRYAGILKIDWRMVQRLSSDRWFEVELENGRRLYGSVRAAEQGLLIMTKEDAVPVAASRVVAMTPLAEQPADTFFDRVRANVDVGFSLTGGNSRTRQSSLGIAAQYRGGKNQIKLAANSLFARQHDAPTASSHTASMRFDRSLNTSGFSFALTGVERDERRRLNLRTNVGGGLGWKLIESSGGSNLSLLGGFTLVDENFRQKAGETPRESSGEGLAGVDWETLGPAGVRFTARLQLHPHLLERGRYRMSFDSTVRVPLVGNVNWNLKVFDRFDSQPPVRVQRNDYAVISGLGIVF